MSERGKYVVIEGNDGTGKSTQVGLLQAKLIEHGIESVQIEEPGSDGNNAVPVANAIREVIKNGALERDGTTNLLLFTAARHELWHQRIEPALKLGKWVIAARNYFSTIAYQGGGEGLDSETIISTTEKFTDPHYIHPDLAVILTLDNHEERAKRIAERGALENPDTFESRDDEFQTNVNDAYSEIARAYDLPTISANQSREQISVELFEHVKKLL